jgi:hypothetical protein
LKLSEFTVETMQPHVGSLFHLTMADGTVFDLELEKAVVLLPKDETPLKKRDQFGMYFFGPPDILIRGNSYPTRHDVLGGPFLMFYTPLERGEDGRYVYEVVFT